MIVRDIRDETAAAPHWKERIDAFFNGIRPDEPDSFFEALAVLREVDTVAMAQDVVSSLARVYLDATPGERARVGLDRSLPNFGHVVVASSDNATLSFSVRTPVPHVDVHVLSTSNCHEYHRIERGAVRITECAYAGDIDGQRLFSPAGTLVLGAGAEIERRAGESAFTLHAAAHAAGPCLLLSAAGAAMGDFKTNLDARTGTPLGQSFSRSRHSVLANVLELCAQFPDPLVGERCAQFLTHRNHKVRLAALKACLMNNTESPQALAQKASTDAHPSIAGLGKQLLELAQ